MPNDPIMLLSYVNTQLRDFYPDLHSLCADKGVEECMILEKLRSVDYEYDEKQNQFV